MRQAALHGAHARWHHPLQQNRTALHVAAAHRCEPDILRLLLQQAEGGAGALQLSALLDASGNTPLHAYVIGTAQSPSDEASAEGLGLLLECVPPVCPLLSSTSWE